jgi:hypothetical protein
MLASPIGVAWPSTFQEREGNKVSDSTADDGGPSRDDRGGNRDPTVIRSSGHSIGYLVHHDHARSIGVSKG